MKYFSKFLANLYCFLENRPTLFDYCELQCNITFREREREGEYVIAIYFISYALSTWKYNLDTLHYVFVILH